MGKETAQTSPKDIMVAANTSRDVQHLYNCKDANQSHRKYHFTLFSTSTACVCATSIKIWRDWSLTNCC